MKYISLITLFLLLINCTTTEVILPDEETSQRIPVNIPSELHGTYNIVLAGNQNCGIGYEMMFLDVDYPIVVDGNSIMHQEYNDITNSTFNFNLIDDSYEPEELPADEYPYEYIIQLNNFGGDQLKLRLTLGAYGTGSQLQVFNISARDGDVGCYRFYALLN